MVFHRRSAKLGFGLQCSLNSLDQHMGRPVSIRAGTFLYASRILIRSIWFKTNFPLHNIWSLPMYNWCNRMLSNIFWRFIPWGFGSPAAGPIRGNGKAKCSPIPPIVLAMPRVLLFRKAKWDIMRLHNGRGSSPTQCAEFWVVDRSMLGENFLHDSTKIVPSCRPRNARHHYVRYWKFLN